MFKKALIFSFLMMVVLGVVIARAGAGGSCAKCTLAGQTDMGGNKLTEAKCEWADTFRYTSCFQTDATSCSVDTIGDYCPASTDTSGGGGSGSGGGGDTGDCQNTLTRQCPPSCMDCGGMYY